MKSPEELIKHLEDRGVLHSSEIKHALEKIDRIKFISKDLYKFAYEDIALPTIAGQTISQPYTVVFMLELLVLKEGDKVMDVGFGSGWQTALLAEIVGRQGKVYALERLMEVYSFGLKNLSKYKYLLNRIELFNINAFQGLPDIANSIGGFDKVIVSANLDELPQNWKSQLKVGGIIVYPMNNSIYKEVKVNEEEFKRSEFSGFVFVPFIID